MLSLFVASPEKLHSLCRVFVSSMRYVANVHRIFVLILWRSQWYVGFTVLLNTVPIKEDVFCCSQKCSTNFLTAVFRKPAFIIAMPEYDFFFVLKEGNFIHYGCLDVLFHRDGIELLIWLTCPALNFTGNYYERGWTLSVFILWRKWLSECWPQVSNVKVICVAHIFCASPCV